MNTSSNPILIYVIASIPIIWRIFQIKNKHRQEINKHLKFQVLLLSVPFIGIAMHVNGITDLRSHILMIAIIGLILFSVSRFRN